MIPVVEITDFSFMCLMPSRNDRKKKREGGRGTVLALTIFCKDVAMKEGRAVQEHVTR